MPLKKLSHCLGLQRTHTSHLGGRFPAVSELRSWDEEIPAETAWAFRDAPPKKAVCCPAFAGDDTLHLSLGEHPVSAPHPPQCAQAGHRGTKTPSTSPCPRPLTCSPGGTWFWDSLGFSCCSAGGRKAQAATPGGCEMTWLILRLTLTV